MRTMHSNELVELNVGGTRYMTTVKTLLGPAAQGSMLARTVELHAEYQAPDPLQFTASGVSSDPKPNSLNKGAAAAGAGSSNMWGIAPCLKDKAGALFIDRDGPLFRFVLAYLRMGDKFIPPDDLLTAQQLLLEADYYQLQGLISIMQLHVSKLRKEQKVHRSDLEALLQHTAAAQDSIIECLQITAATAKQVLQKLEDMENPVTDLRTYLVPKMMYHTGKRGGPNYHRPRNLLEDLQ